MQTKINIPTEIHFTNAEWSLPHFASPDTSCKCGYVLVEHLFGAVATVHFNDGRKVGEGGGDNPEQKEAVGNAYLIRSAPDMFHALIKVAQAINNGMIEDQSIIDSVKFAIDSTVPDERSFKKDLRHESLKISTKKKSNL